jgi:serine/threonine-protein kinase
MSIHDRFIGDNSMSEPRDPDRSTPEPPSDDPSSEAGHPDDGVTNAEGAANASTIRDGPTDDATRVMPPATVVLSEGPCTDAGERLPEPARADRSTGMVPDESVERPTTIAGYEILGVLGRGTMAVVYKARQRGLGRVVALKMIRDADHPGPDELSRFRREAVALAALQHPNIVQIHEVGEDRGQPYFSLEYVEGGTLASKIGGVPQPAAEAALLVRALADAMESAHRLGIVHRDLKPANVLLTGDGQPKIGDFGLVKRLTDEVGQTQSGSIVGSPGYMAPEQAEGRTRDVGPLADVYGLGAILYHLLTGRPPFRAATVVDTLQQVRTEEPIPPSQFQPRLPRDIETICLKCLQKDPARRYPSAGELAEDLRRFESGEAIRARPVGRAERLWQWARRNPRVAALSAAVALLLVGWSITSTWLYRRARASERAAVRAAAAARENEALARNNADEARRQAERAQASGNLARRREELARATAQEAFNRVIGVGEQVLRRLQARYDPARARAEWQRLRDDLAGVLQKELLPIANRIESQGATSFGLAAMHQAMGDLLRRCGQGEEALRHFRRTIELIEPVARAQPDNDVARANLGVMHQRLGELAMEVDGDARRALDDLRRAWDLQDRIAREPRSKFYTKADNHRLLSHAAFKLGLAELALGHPADAYAHFRTAMENRKAWTEAAPQDVTARSYLAEAELWLGVAASRLDRWPESRQHLDEAVRITDELARRFGDVSGFKTDLAAVHAAYGDALLRRGEDAGAEEVFRRAMRHAESALAQNPEELRVPPLLAAIDDGLAAVALRARRESDARRLFQTSLEIRSELVRLDPANLPRRAELALALAHCGRRDEAVKQADELMRTAVDRPALLIPLARCFAACAAAEPDAARRRRAEARMVDALSSASRNGYRDAVAVNTEPDFAPFRDAAAFQAVMNALSSTPGR